MAWSVEWDERARRELNKLDRGAQIQILEFLRERVARASDPRQLGKPLTGIFKGLWRYRSGNFRILVRFEDDRMVVLVLRVGHRKDVYR